jgi:hypothetical protein
VIAEWDSRSRDRSLTVLETTTSPGRACTRVDAHEPRGAIKRVRWRPFVGFQSRSLSQPRTSESGWEFRPDCLNPNGDRLVFATGEQHPNQPAPAVEQRRPTLALPTQARRGDEI